jgi:RelA/SpoT family (p)ppGpp synthetase
LIKEAYHFAEKGHSGQKRKSGEPYITHPLNVAKLIASINGSEVMVIAALFHDLLEDTDVREGDIKDCFGEDVLKIVKACTNLSKISEFKERQEIEAERLRNIFLVLASEPRAAVVKIADRLHNMRTISALSADRANIIANETLLVHAPISRRLGLRTFTSELEDLSFKVINNNAYELTKRELEDKNTLKLDLSNIICSISSFLNENNLKYQIEGRIKNVYSVYNKSIKYGLSPISLHDLLGVRLIFSDEDDLYKALSTLAKAYPDYTKRFKDYIRFPKSNGYRSIHLVISNEYGRDVEVQLRTEDMHRHAEFGSASHWGYKEEIEKNYYFNWVERLLKWQDEKISLDENLKSAYLELNSTEDILLLTPKGDIITLPNGATILDFAYALHNDLGNKLSYGKINGRKAKIFDQLQDGDKVEIFSRGNNAPKIEWLALVKTAKARNAISKYLNKQIRRRSINLGEKFFINHFMELKIFYYNLELDNLLSYTGYKNKDDLFLAIFEGNYNISKYKKINERKFNHIFLQYGKENLNISPVGSLDINYLLAICCLPKEANYLKAIYTLNNFYLIHDYNCKTLIDNIKASFGPDIEFYKIPESHYIQKIKVTSSVIDDNLIEFIIKTLFDNNTVLHKIIVFGSHLEIVLSSTKNGLTKTRSNLRKYDNIDSLNIIL